MSEERKVELGGASDGGGGAEAALTVKLSWGQSLTLFGVIYGAVVTVVIGIMATHGQRPVEFTGVFLLVLFPAWLLWIPGRVISAMRWIIRTGEKRATLA